MGGRSKGPTLTGVCGYHQSNGPQGSTQSLTQGWMANWGARRSGRATPLSEKLVSSAGEPASTALLPRAAGRKVERRGHRTSSKRMLDRAAPRERVRQQHPHHLLRGTVRSGGSYRPNQGRVEGRRRPPPGDGHRRRGAADPVRQVSITRGAFSARSSPRDCGAEAASPSPR